MVVCLNGMCLSIEDSLSHIDGVRASRFKSQAVFHLSVCFGREFWCFFFALVESSGVFLS